MTISILMILETHKRVYHIATQILTKFLFRYFRWCKWDNETKHVNKAWELVFFYRKWVKSFVKLVLKIVAETENRGFISITSFYIPISNFCFRNVIYVVRKPCMEYLIKICVSLYVGIYLFNFDISFKMPNFKQPYYFLLYITRLLTQDICHFLVELLINAGIRMLFAINFTIESRPTEL